MKSVSSRWLDKQADIQNGRLDSNVKRSVSRDFQRAGLDGNGSFQEVGDGIRAAFDVLEKYGIDPDTVLNSHLFMGDHGRRTLEIAFHNPVDPFSPVPIKNSVLVFSWYCRESGNFEILCYLS